MASVFLRDAFVVLSCQFWSALLQCGGRLSIHTIKLFDRVISGVRFLTGVCLSGTLIIVDLLHSNPLYLNRMFQCGLHTVPWSQIGILMLRFAA